MAKYYLSALPFPRLEGRRVDVEFSSSDITGNGGSPGLRQVDRRLGLSDAVARYYTTRGARRALSTGWRHWSVSVCKRCFWVTKISTTTRPCGTMLAWVVRTVSGSNRCLHDCGDALESALSGFALGVPDGVQRAQDVRCSDCVDRLVTEGGIGIVAQRGLPLRRGARVAPRRTVEVNDLGCKLAETGGPGPGGSARLLPGTGWVRRRGCRRSPAGFGDHAVVECLVARFGRGDVREGA